jgi:AcrR family transcriptional regulator
MAYYGSMSNDRALMTDAPVGLRSIKKQLTRESIADAALRLSLEHGLAHVTIDEIADQAFVSPRTVSNYFSCKEEAVVAAGNTLPALIALFADAPRVHPPMVSMRQVVNRFFGTRSDDELEQTREWLGLIEANPALRAYQMASYDRAEADICSIIAEREGLEDASQLYPRLAAATAIGAIKVVLETWARTGARRNGLADLVDSAFDQIDTGFTQPVR